MKRYMTTLIVLIIGMVLTVGCIDQGEVLSDATDETPTVNENVTSAVNTETNNDDMEAPDSSDVMERFYSLLTPDSKPKDLVDFFKENMTELKEEEAKIMVNWIMIYQTEVFERFNKTNLLYEEEYSQAYFEKMGGALNPEKFDEIENDAIRKDFENLTYSFLTIVMYKHNLYVVTDWETISSFKEYFSDEFNLAIQNKISSRDIYLQGDCNQFPDSSEFRWISETIIDDNRNLDILMLGSFIDAYITNGVNEIIASSIVELAEGKESYAVTMNSIYNNMKYTSVFISMRYVNDVGNTNYNERPMSFDLESGEELTLDSYLGLSESDSIEFANNTAGTDFTVMPHMEFYKAGIILKARKDDDSAIRFGYITLKDLIPFKSEEMLFSWYNY